MMNNIDSTTVLETLQEAEKRLEMFFEQSLDGFFFMMLDEPVLWNETTDKEKTLDYVFAHQRITKINQAMLTQYGAEEKDFLGLTPNDFFTHDIQHGREVWRDFFDKGKLHVETREKRFDGSDLFIEGDYICFHDKQGRITGHFGIQRDVTDRVKAEEELKKSRSILGSIFNEMEDVGWSVTIPDYIPIFMTPSVEKLYGIPHDEFMQDPEIWQNVIHDDDKHIAKKINENIQQGFDYNEQYRILTRKGELKWVRNKGKLIFDENKKPVRLDGYIEDITLQKEYEAELRTLSVTDHLTNIANRRAFIMELGREFEKVKRYNQLCSVAYVDVDHFKSINDRYGHAAGDDALKKLAEILKSTRNTDMAARIGGEEFSVVMPMTSKEQGMLIGERIREQVENLTIKHEGKTFTMTVSVGITQMDSHDKTLDDVLIRADKALYMSKNNGRNCTTVL